MASLNDIITAMTSPTAERAISLPLLLAGSIQPRGGNPLAGPLTILGQAGLEHAGVREHKSALETLARQDQYPFPVTENTKPEDIIAWRAQKDYLTGHGVKPEDVPSVPLTAREEMQLAGTLPSTAKPAKPTKIDRGLYLTAKGGMPLPPDVDRNAVIQVYEADEAAREARREHERRQNIAEMTGAIETRQEAAENRKRQAELAKPVESSKDTYLYRSGPRRGQKVSGVTLGEAQKIGTKVDKQEMKVLGAGDDMSFWLGQLGIQPGGVVTPEAERIFAKLYAKSPGLFQTGAAWISRSAATASGDEDARKLEQVAAIMQTSFAKANAGTLRVNAAELALIQAAHPERGDTAQTAVQKMQRLSMYLESVNRRILGDEQRPPEDAAPFAELPDEYRDLPLTGNRKLFEQWRQGK